jgi:hypothetical protein
MRGSCDCRGVGLEGDVAMSGWYVLYRGRYGHSVRAAACFDEAISAAWQLRRDGRDVIQVGPRDRRRADEVIDAGEIQRICALLGEEAALPLPG